MIPSIIRRFAKYYGIVLDDSSGGEFSIYELAEGVYGTHETERVVAVVQALTRIEDAEIALSVARLNSGITPRTEDAAFIADKLCAMAGIDPNKWREVKE